jgi:hypothetical protein
MNERELSSEVQNNDFVFIYQMGKVASTSLLNSINAYDYIARQTHFLGKENLHEMLDHILIPGINDFFYYHNKGQLVENIENMRLMNLLKKLDKKIKIITLVRKADDWFWSAITQQYEGLWPKYKRYARNKCYEGDDHFEAIKIFYNDFIHFCMEHSISIGEHKESNRKIFRLREKLNDPDNNLFVEHLMILNGALVWHDKFFNDAFGIDVFSKPLKDDHIVLEDGSYHVLLLKYENIKALVPHIGTFLQIENFSLKQDNTSSVKKQYQVIQNIKQAFNPLLHQTFHINETKYMKHFYSEDTLFT